LQLLSCSMSSALYHGRQLRSPMGAVVTGGACQKTTMDVYALMNKLVGAVATIAT